MPTTARFSQNFYERFGDQAAGELVTWLNSAHEESRAEIRELNEMNAARLDAHFVKMDQRFAQIDERFAQIDRRFDQIDRRLERIDERLAKSDDRLSAIDERFARVDEKFALQREFLERSLKEQTRWMLAGWAMVFLAVIGGIALRP